MAVTPASLVAVYPEWEQVNTALPDVVLQAIAQGLDSVDEAVVGDRYDEAVMLAAGAWLYSHPYSRDMRDPSDAASNTYKDQLYDLMVSKGSAYRTVWTGDFGGWT